MSSQHNVVMKFSSLKQQQNCLTVSDEVVREVSEVLLDAFGADRLLWGSDWPMSQLYDTYEHTLRFATSILSTLSTSERSAIFGQNAARVYRLPSQLSMGTAVGLVDSFRIRINGSGAKTESPTPATKWQQLPTHSRDSSSSRWRDIPANQGRNDPTDRYVK